MRTCCICEVNPIDWAWQPFGPSDDPRAAAFVLLGNHYRGFPILKVCDTCKHKITERTDTVSFVFKMRHYDLTPDATDVKQRPLPNGHTQGDRYG